MTIDLKYSIWTLIRRLPIFTLVTTLISVGGLWGLQHITPTYESSAKILIEDSGQTAVDTAVRFEQLKHRALAAAELPPMLSRLATDDLTDNETLSRLLQATRIELLDTDRAYHEILVSFRHASPDTAQLMANELTKLLLSENINLQTRRLEQTLEIYRTEVTVLKKALSDKAMTLAEFKMDAAGALPDAETALSARRDEILQLLSTGTSEEPASVGIIAWKGVPDKTAASLDTAPVAGAESLREELKELNILEAQIPQNAVKLEALQRDHEMVEKQYMLAEQRLTDAVADERLDYLSRGDQLLVIEPAATPSVPLGPSQQNLQIIILAFALFCATITVSLMQWLDNTVRRPLDLERRFDTSVFAVIPEIKIGRRTHQAMKG